MNTRKINPENKPGPKPIDGKPKCRTNIFLASEEWSNNLDELSKELKISRAEIIREAVETSYPEKFKNGNS